MEWLYLKGISVEEQDDFGRTALQWACYKGHRKTVQWLLSRQASVAHRDLEGMTAIHWAAFKGNEQAAEMLLDIGAVQLLDVPDARGDTPIALAMRKRNRYLVLLFHKCQLFQYLIGRPHISHNNFANLFIAFMAFNLAVFAFVVAPGIANEHPLLVLGWALLMCASLLLWVQNCFADPGWLRPKAINPQHHLIGEEPWRAFDAAQPIESQMAHHDAITQELVVRDALQGFGELEKMEFEQNKFNYQRQLIVEARKRLSQGTPGVENELQPLMGLPEVAPAAAMGYRPTHVDQLDKAAQALRERELATGETIGRARVQRLLSEGCGEYLQLVDRGEFKQVCVVCRARRRMRSHHCKECGRCVDRMDHHCPWIDNCVGLGNQRAFFCFIVLLLATIVGFYVCVVLYAFDTVFPGVANASFADFIDSLSSGTFGPELRPILVMLTAAFDLVWLVFVGALVGRQAAYMFVNITTYEVLVRPQHVQRRFPKGRGKFWFLQGGGILSSIRNCMNYWTLNTDGDSAEFAGTTPQESFPMATDGSHTGNDQATKLPMRNGSRENKGTGYCQAPSSGISGVSGGSFPPQAPAYQYNLPAASLSRPANQAVDGHGGAPAPADPVQDSVAPQKNSHYSQYSGQSRAGGGEHVR
eukprot:TRINITY_DN40767_c0_g1_i3.p1 TRINITY_DN40767_c0_g1~~TRINITY_DN40767_c0_g1_i3.p1  ORF type:complete len:677 (-),score=123.05 TRINITY_DN40767_c0_g1_i3:123-2051(-)